MKLFLITAFAIVSLNTVAQVRSSKPQLYPIYEKIEYAHLPDDRRSEKGRLFFTLNQSNYNDFAKTKPERVINLLSKELYVTKFKKDRHWYTHYRPLEYSTTTSVDEKFKSLTDSTYIYITAKKNKRVWSWPRLAMQLKEIGVDTLYRIAVCARQRIVPSNILYFSYLKTVELSADIQGLGQKSHRSFDISVLPHTEVYLTVGFDDLLVRRNYLHDIADLKNMYLSINNEGVVVLYCAVKDVW